jgi:ribosome-associated translation inhibitor RaiA
VSADQATVAIELHLPADLPRSERREILERFERLARSTDDPIEGFRITLRRPETRAARLRWVADASLVLNGKRLASHATGSNAKEAADRLNRQTTASSNPRRPWIGAHQAVCRSPGGRVTRPGVDWS